MNIQTKLQVNIAEIGTEGKEERERERKARVYTEGTYRVHNVTHLVTQPVQCICVNRNITQRMCKVTNQNESTLLYQWNL